MRALTASLTRFALLGAGVLAAAGCVIGPKQDDPLTTGGTDTGPAVPADESGGGDRAGDSGAMDATSGADTPIVATPDGALDGRGAADSGAAVDAHPADAHGDTATDAADAPDAPSDAATDVSEAG